MKHYFPFAIAAAFALWTYALLSYQKRAIRQKLSGPDIKSKIEDKMDDLINKIIPDIALPFLPPTLFSKLKSKGSEELVNLIPEVNQEIDRQFEKYTLIAVFISALIGFAAGVLCILASGSESYR